MSDTVCSIALLDLAATARLGAALSRRLVIGDVVAMHGDLGAGKTELARAIIRAAAGDEELIVPSPTFTLAETYDTLIGVIWHFDLYRLGSPEQVWELGFEEALAGGISLVEWPERIGALLPKSRFELSLGVAAGDVRVAQLGGAIPRLDALAREVARG